MITKHFFKTLVLFTGMIALGMIGLFVVNYFGQDGVEATSVNNDTQVAK